MPGLLDSIIEAEPLGSADAWRKTLKTVLSRVAAPVPSMDEMTALYIRSFHKDPSTVPLDALDAIGLLEMKSSEEIDRLAQSGEEKMMGIGLMGSTSMAKGGLLTKMPKLAERYPRTSRPERAFDRTKGRWYDKKTTSKEAQQASALRKEAQQLINTNDPTYAGSRYFNPEERYYANPGDDIPNAFEVVPKKAETQAKWSAVAQNPTALSKWDAAFHAGKEINPGMETWYAMGQLQDDMVRRLGPGVGEKAFRAFADGMGLTTGGQPPDMNLLLSQYGRFMESKGQTIPSATNALPYPLASGQYGNPLAGFKKTSEAGGRLDIGNPKGSSFSGNIQGRASPATLDTQMMMAGYGTAAPQPGTYGLFAGAVDPRAAAHGVRPDAYQALAWTGIKGGKDVRPLIEDVNRMLFRTSHVTGVPINELVERGLLEGKTPSYGFMGTIPGMEDRR